MTRAPLTLNDTAMVLLQEYVELTDHLAALSQSLTQGLSPSEIFSSKVVNQLSERMQASESLMTRFVPVQTALLEEIRLLWTSPDVTPVRSLDWHLTFDESLMTTMETHFRENANLAASPASPVDVVGINVGFTSQLVNAYKADLASRKLDTGNDQS